MKSNGLLFAVFLIIIIILKQIISYWNTKIYTREYRDILAKHQSGYFGVGVYQPKLSIGQVCLIVIDKQMI